MGDIAWARFRKAHLEEHEGDGAQQSSEEGYDQILVDAGGAAGITRVPDHEGGEAHLRHEHAQEAGEILHRGEGRQLVVHQTHVVVVLEEAGAALLPALD
jgi:hypothetical protein